MSRKITIIIEDSLPWYHPYTSADRWLEAQRERDDRDRKRIEREAGLDRVPSVNQDWRLIFQPHRQMDTQKATA